MTVTVSGGENIAFTYQMSECAELRSYLATWRGERLAHIRMVSVSKRGKVGYTRNGVCVRADDLPQLYRAVEKLSAVPSGSHTGGDEPNVLYSFPKNMNEEVRAYFQVWKGEIFAHVRILRADENDEDWFTRRGISVPLDQLAVLHEATHALVALAKEEQQALIDELDSE